jgi:hypothetical protein
MRLLTIVGLLLLGIVSTEAGNIRSRRVEGVVERVDSHNRHLWVALREPARMWVFDLPRWAPIYKDHRRVPAADMQAGDHVRLYYRSPLFGNRFTTRVFILTDS